MDLLLLLHSFWGQEIQLILRGQLGSFKYGIMISAGLTVVVLIFLRPLKVLNTPEDLLKEAYDYIFIIFAGMTILMLYNVCAALLRSIGRFIYSAYF